jgi:serine protease Do
VTFADGTTVPAEVVGKDPDSDLAVVKVDVSAEHLHPVQLADSTNVKVGQMAIAIGNPFGLSETMTVGIVSGLERSLPVQSTGGQSLSYSIPDIIQTDAPINPGNSGGVLVDTQGQVIGVTSAISSPVQASAGIGFAIPSVIVQKIVPVLITDGQYQHPRLGISGTSLTSELAEAMYLNSEQRGVLVVEVQSDGPADKAGLKGSDRTATIKDQEIRVGGDVIIGIDDQPVDTFEDLTIYLERSTEVGQTVSLTILRDGDEKQIEVVLDARSTTTDETGARHGDAAYLGIHGGTLTPAVAAAMNLKSDQSGVLITDIAQDSPADQAGLHGSYKTAVIDGQLVPVGGDVITALDGHPVDSIETLLSLLGEHQPGDTIQLTILRDGQQQDIDVTLGALP